MLVFTKFISSWNCTKNTMKRTKKNELNRNSSKLDTSPQARRKRFVIFSRQVLGTLTNKSKTCKNSVSTYNQPNLESTRNQPSFFPLKCRAQDVILKNGCKLKMWCGLALDRLDWHLKILKREEILNEFVLVTFRKKEDYRAGRFLLIHALTLVGEWQIVWFLLVAYRQALFITYHCHLHFLQLIHTHTHLHYICTSLVIAFCGEKVPPTDMIVVFPTDMTEVSPTDITMQWVLSNIPAESRNLSEV
jgi:hypothetical protein